MPQIKATRRLGVALDHGMTQTPAPVYINTKNFNSREYRANRADYDNMLLRETRIDNRHEDHSTTKSHGNGFPGAVQFVQYLGKLPMRPGVKLERDCQMSTFCHDNSMPLNLSQMPGAGVKFAALPSSEEVRGHEVAMSSTRNLRQVAEAHHKQENPHLHIRNELDKSMQRQAAISEHAEKLRGMRQAGTACINPRLGTCGSLPDLTGLKGKDGLNKWRTCTPYSLDPALHNPAAYPFQATFVNPY